MKRFIVPANILDPTLDALAEAGKLGYEAILVWGGARSEDGMTLGFLAAYKPYQEAYRTEHGLLVHVDDQALLRVNREFNERGLILAGQAHSHPTDAYHSETDDTRPLVTILGGLSVVVPDFALGGRADLTRFEWFRLAGFGRWLPVSEETELVIH